ncbi:DUF6591 domain-containing protein [Barnesiella sp. An22]|uniref:DUF6591 domain-containing protein n=1 Tax=Barnesiella sp. An22 TaxID=1965590 RepID=UPI000B38B762|nr:DUF6591 domain-containing protein [Barnesiella sp. An22]OUO98120.1 hypothetical protein B5F38_06810 [Barnesiella sp. An22]
MKKTLFVFGLAAIVAMMASCSGSGKETKTITPTFTEFSSGEIAKYVEVVDQPAELTFMDDKGIYLKVTLRLVQDGIKGVDARDINFENFIGCADIDLLNEEEGNMSTVSMKSEDELKFKKFLTGNVGDTAVFVFERPGYSQEYFKETIKFMPAATADITVEAGDNTSVSDSDSSDTAVSSDSGSEDWDSLLDSYEEYVDMYISLLKKASAGDLSAVSEYTSYMSKAQEVSQKMADATSKLSPAQLSRFNKINQKMLQAAQNMN